MARRARKLLRQQWRRSQDRDAKCCAWMPLRAFAKVENHSVDVCPGGAIRFHRELMRDCKTGSSVEASNDVDRYAQRPERQAQQIAGAATQIALMAKSLRARHRSGPQQKDAT